LHRHVLRLTNGQLAIGDADSKVTFNDLDKQTRVRVHAANEADFGATDGRIDLAPQSQ